MHSRWLHPLDPARWKKLNLPPATAFAKAQQMRTLRAGLPNLLLADKCVAAVFAFIR
jgi:hypothetical protein